jgi:hypothetical protein
MLKSYFIFVEVRSVELVSLCVSAISTICMHFSISGTALNIYFAPCIFLQPRLPLISLSVSIV